MYCLEIEMAEIEAWRQWQLDETIEAPPVPGSIPQDSPHAGTSAKTNESNSQVWEHRANP